MKILIFPVLLIVLVYCVYHRVIKNKRNFGMVNNKWIVITFLVVCAILFFSYKFYLSINAPDTYCFIPHHATSSPASQLQTADDYFTQGNYDYDTGNCQQAIADYTQAIQLDRYKAEAYNNRAYTNMRMHNYTDALSDLDMAIELRPDYVNALMNRGDIYNYYYSIDHQKAISDYNKVIALGATKGNSVCGHKAMAESNNVIPLVFLRIFASLNCK